MQRLSTLHILTLSFVPGLGKSTLQRILNQLSFQPSSLKELYEVTYPFIKLTQAQLEIALNHAEQTLQEHEKAGINTIGIDDPKFPQKLRNITNPPSVLYVKGDATCLNPERSVAVIGTRQPTDYGKRTAVRIARRVAEQGLIVVSGLAQGCDTAGHEGCLQEKGRTVAVLAHGLDRIYPSENRELAQRIIDSGGCLVSEYPIGNKLFKSQFVERDRIQSGLSSAVVIIETDIKGGTMHTARFCLEQGRVLACVDYSLEYRSHKSRGNEQLITEGKATPIKKSDDFKNFIINVFGEFIITDTKNTEPPSSDLDITEQGKAQAEDIEVVHQDKTVAIQVFLSKEEKDRFETKCAANGMTANQGLYKLVDNYLNNGEVNITQSKSNKTKAKHSTEEFANQLVLPIISTEDSRNKTIEESDNTENIKDAFNIKDLAKRLNVSESTIDRNRKKGVESFKEWSRKKDPNGHSWEYSEMTKLFEVAF